MHLSRSDPFNNLAVTTWLILPWVLGWGAAFPLGVAAQDDLPQSAPVLPEDDFWRLVDQTRRAAEQGEPSTDLLLARWEALETVTLTAGGQVAIDTRMMVEWLSADPPDWTAAARFAAALQETRQRWPASRFADSDTVQTAYQALDEILADEKYSQAVESGENWLLDWLQRLFEGGTPASRPASNAGTAAFEGIRLLTIIGAVATTLLIVSLLLNASANLVGAPVRLDRHEELAEPLTSTQALDRADRVADAGDLRTAVRYLYLSSLLSLDEKNLVRIDRSLTNREVVRAVADRPQLARTMDEVVEVFDRVWYGFDTIDQATFARYRQRVAELQQLEREGG